MSVAYDLENVDMSEKLPINQINTNGTSLLLLGRSRAIKNGHATMHSVG